MSKLYSWGNLLMLCAVVLTVALQPVSVLALPWTDESDQTKFSRASGKLAGGETIEISNANFYGEIYKRLGKIVSLGIGDNHYVALLDDGTLLTWGDNSEGQLGNGTTSSTSDEQAYDITDSIFSETIKDNDGNAEPDVEQVVKVAAGANSSFALTDKGRVYWWGDGQKTPTKLLGMHGQTAEDLKVDRTDGDTEAIIKTFSVEDKSNKRNGEQLFAWRSDDSGYIAGETNDHLGCIEKLPCARGISGLGGQRFKDFDISTDGRRVAILTKADKFYTWDGNDDASETKFTLNKEPNDDRGLDFVAAGDVESNNPNQMYILASRNNIVFSWNDNSDPGSQGASLGFPTKSPIKQIMTDGYDGHYFLTESGQIYMLYANGDGYIPLDPLPKGEAVQKMHVKPIDDEYSKGTVIALTASGRIYEASTHDGSDDLSRTRDITPKLIYDTHEKGALVEKISFGGSDVDITDADYKDGDDTTIIVTVPGQVREGTMDVVETDNLGNQVLLGAYTYDDPTPEPDPGNSGSNENGNNNENTSGSGENKPTVPVNPNKPTNQLPGSENKLPTIDNEDSLKKLLNNKSIQTLISQLTKNSSAESASKSSNLVSSNKSSSANASGSSSATKKNPNSTSYSASGRISAPNTGAWLTNSACTD